MTDPRDLAAQQAMQAYAAGDLPRIKARADKWIAGFAALTGVLATAALIKGPDTLTKVSDKDVFLGLGPRDLVVIALAAGGIGLALGIYDGYRAANGSPFDNDEVARLADAPQAVTGLADKWTAAVKAAATSSSRALRRAAISTVAGMVLLAAGLIYASYNPEGSSDTPTCIRSGHSTTRLDGPLPEVKQGSVTVVACPKS